MNAVKQRGRYVVLSCLLAAGCHLPQGEPAGGGSRSDAGTAQSHALASHGADDREQLGDLAPLPDNALAGDDADGDHIRDDVAAYIDDSYREHPRTRLAARQFARAQEHALVYAGDPDKARDAGDEIARAIECLYAFLSADDADAVWKELQARTVDNDERLDAYFAAEKALAGGYFASAAEPVQSCAFDGQGLEP